MKKDSLMTYLGFWFVGCGRKERKFLKNGWESEA